MPLEINVTNDAPEKHRGTVTITYRPADHQDFVMVGVSYGRPGADEHVEVSTLVHLDQLSAAVEAAKAARRKT